MAIKRLLIVTQAVDANSSTLGFMLEWLREFARQFDRVEVIAFKTGPYELPPNVRVHAVRRTEDDTAWQRLTKYWSLLWNVLPEVDGVFVHMSPEYLLAGWPMFFLRGKPATQWYAHRHVSWRIRLATALAVRVLTSMPNAFQIKTPKVVVVGQGVPTDIFTPASAPPTNLQMITAGRISEIKGVALMVEALALVRKTGLDATLDIIGQPVMPADFVYTDRLKARINELGLSEAVRFLGIMPFAKLPERYRTYALALNMSPTGAPDKAALEAMSAGLPIVVTNRTFLDIMGPDAVACVAEPVPDSVAEKIGAILRLHDAGLGLRLRNIVIRDHSLKRLVANVKAAFG